jgi:pseudaminic acid cytidylyltransferase
MNVCIIPARGGSKRIPRKNIKEFNGKPLIAYSIEAALKSGCFDRVVVSTDDDEIANTAMSFGAEAPFLRPTNLSNHTTGTLEVIKHAIEHLEQLGEKFQSICCLYATAPFIQAETIALAYEQLKSSKAEYCFTATSFASPIQRAFKITKQNRAEMFYPKYYKRNSQDLIEAYHDAGQFYWGKAEVFKQMKPIYSKFSSPYILPRYLVLDIDTMEDWKHAEFMYQVLDKSKLL